MTLGPLFRTLLALAALCAALGLAHLRADQQAVSAAAALAQPLTATPHPPLPRDPLRLWIAPK